MRTKESYERIYVFDRIAGVAKINHILSKIDFGRIGLKVTGISHSRPETIAIKVTTVDPDNPTTWTDTSVKRMITQGFVSEIGTTVLDNGFSVYARKVGGRDLGPLTWSAPDGKTDNVFYQDNAFIGASNKYIKDMIDNTLTHPNCTLDNRYELIEFLRRMQEKLR